MHINKQGFVTLDSQNLAEKKTKLTFLYLDSGQESSLVSGKLICHGTIFRYIDRWKVRAHQSRYPLLVA